MFEIGFSTIRDKNKKQTEYKTLAILKLSLVVLSTLFYGQIFTQSITPIEQTLLDEIFEKIELEEFNLVDSNCFSKFHELDYLLYDSIYVYKTHKEYAQLVQKDQNWTKLIDSLSNKSSCQIFNCFNFPNTRFYDPENSEKTGIILMSNFFVLNKKGLIYIELINKYNQYSSFLIFFEKKNESWAIVGKELIGIS